MNSKTKCIPTTNSLRERLEGHHEYGCALTEPPYEASCDCSNAWLTLRGDLLKALSETLTTNAAPQGGALPTLPARQKESRLMFPDDACLLARGKYSTLSYERHEQIRRVQDICRTIQATVPQILTDFQEEPPVGIQHLPMLAKCLENLTSARERIMTMCLGMAELKMDAWPK